MKDFVRQIDDKGIGIARQLVNLRDSIDVHRIIGLNAEKILNSNVNGRVFGHYQRLSHESIAIGFCKIYEYSDRNELDSIPAAIRLVRLHSGPLDRSTSEMLSGFGNKYGIKEIPTAPGDYIQKVFATFKGTNDKDFQRLKDFRDKIGAHRESGIEIDALPSHNTFECLFDFAYDFCRMTAQAFVGCGPTPIEGYAGRALIDSLCALGISDPKFDFDG